ncbi:MAG TPA: hypothetical protein PK423_09825 [Clostridiales bacterium]|nr:hypothetical protein [Candidatus Atribacteria bacterium]HPT77990.1 hypothetical protein [Candidatus Atribacteria bacterium]HPZ06312.1 hypothetical protein [Clostridiales bacterium]
MKKYLRDIMDEANLQDIDVIIDRSMGEDGADGLSVDNIRSKVLDRTGIGPAEPERHRKHRNNGWQRYVAAAACLVLIVSIGIGASLLLDLNGMMPNANKGEDGLPDDLDDIVWGDQPSLGDDSWIEWNGLNLSYGLYDAIRSNEDKNAVFAVQVTKYGELGRESFVYKGRTIAEYQAEANRLAELAWKLSELIKAGHWLKYGEALYTTGTPDGEKWTRELYDETVQFYGKDLLAKYIVDGELLEDKINEDMDALKNERALAEEALSEAQKAYRSQSAIDDKREFEKQGVPVKIINDRLYIFVTEARLAGIKLTDASTYLFSLGVRSSNTDDAAPPPVD